MRRVTGLRGRMRFRCEIALRFDYGLPVPRVRHTEDGLIAIAGPELVALCAPLHLTPSEGEVVVAEFGVAAGQSCAFSLAYGASQGAPPAQPDVDEGPDETRDSGVLAAVGWALPRRTPWDGAVIRSLLTLKALIYRPTGAMIAAPTTSLPEMPGGPLISDYRYCWLRDATFTLSALLNAGYADEAIQWHNWVLRAIADSPDQMRILYRLDGDRPMYEQIMPWLPGFDGEGPVHSQ